MSHSKKVSAFSVFKGKRDRESVSSLDSRASMRKASSSQSIREDVKKALDGKGKKLMKALKGGSLRSSLRSTPKARPTILPETEKAEPVSLKSVRSTSDLEEQNSAQVDRGKPLSTPVIPKQISAVRPTRNQNIPPSGKHTPNPPPSDKESPGKQSDRSSIETATPLAEAGNKPKSILKPTKTKKTPSPRVSDSERRQSGKNKRLENDEDSKPAKKKRRDNSEVQTQDCSTEEMEHALSFEEESVSSSQLPYMFNSGEEARKIFECLIHPVKPDKFFKELWERKPLLVQRHMIQYNDGWFSTSELDRILREENIQFTTNLDVTTFTNGQRETHNPVGRAYPSTVWDFYQTGCSVRLLNPQTYSRNVWKLLSVLQEYFNCCVGANIYLTPPGTQGFAPHYDDIEAFILQLEGRKHWRLYSPRTDNEVLPRFSSGNFTEKDLGKPILDTVLDPGDLLYFPRGTIHQGNCMEDTHSLHITVSCYQKNTWGDLFEKLVPRALQIAIDEDVEFRRGLPREYSSYMGIAHSDMESSPRNLFLKKVEQLMIRMVQHLPVDSACDQMAKSFIHDSLPPVLSDAEKAFSVHGSGEHWDKEKMCVAGTAEIEPDTTVKIIRKGILRLLTEEDEVRIYHSLENTRLYHEVEPTFIQISAEAAPAVEYLIHSYPKYVPVDSLPLPTLDQRIDVASMMYEKGLLITGEPLLATDEDSS
ncbi:ribosomal oxygenase 1-like isoform X1 [Saccostrea echinata]|uniref:ribosomal oxygenase 1-like isoform X1 n=1 Tax=Saccostrea echinata TaxID=191078 RepID=UPI002A7FBB0B|nr:ribosomal oxygenase 1-like isoform X1 [Saccostrea echinata]